MILTFHTYSQNLVHMKFFVKCQILTVKILLSNVKFWRLFWQSKSWAHEILWPLACFPFRCSYWICAKCYMISATCDIRYWHALFLYFYILFLIFDMCYALYILCYMWYSILTRARTCTHTHTHTCTRTHAHAHTQTPTILHLTKLNRLRYTTLNWITKLNRDECVLQANGRRNSFYQGPGGPAGCVCMCVCACMFLSLSLKERERERERGSHIRQSHKADT